MLGCDLCVRAWRVDGRSSGKQASQQSSSSSHLPEHLTWILSAGLLWPDRSVCLGILSVYPGKGVSQVPGPGSNQSSTGGSDSCMQQMHDSVSHGSPPAHRALALVCSKSMMKFVVVRPKVSKRYLPFSPLSILALLVLAFLAQRRRCTMALGRGIDAPEVL